MISLCSWRYTFFFACLCGKKILSAWENIIFLKLPTRVSLSICSLIIITSSEEYPDYQYYLLKWMANWNVNLIWNTKLLLRTEIFNRPLSCNYMVEHSSESLFLYLASETPADNEMLSFFRPLAAPVLSGIQWEITSSERNAWSESTKRPVTKTSDRKGKRASSGRPHARHISHKYLFTGWNLA